MGVLNDKMTEIDRAIRDELEHQAQLVLAESNLNVGHGDPTEDPDPAVAIIESGRVDVNVSLRTGEVTAVIIYDGPSYVVKQHESHHLRHPRGGGPGFLENALFARARDTENGVAGAVRTVTSGGRVRERRA